MAISSGNVVKRPKVVEESQASDSEESHQQESASEEESEVEPGYVEIKEEVDDDDDDYMGEGDSFNAVPDDLSDVKIEDSDEDEEDQSGGEDAFGDTSGTGEEIKEETDSGGSEDEEEIEDDDFGDDDDDDSEKDGEDDRKSSGSGLANMMARILGTKKSDILSKAKTDREVKKSKAKKPAEDTFEIVDESGQVKTEAVVDQIKEEEEEEEKKSLVSQHERDVYRKLWEEKFRKKPSITQDREKERKLRVLATQGVVQLFSAIEKHKTMMQVKLSECRSIMGREKVLESTGKQAFLDILKQQGKRVKRKTESEEKKVQEEDLKEEVKDEPLEIQLPKRKKPKWNVLSDNFYKEPTLQGWDQQSDDE